MTKLHIRGHINTCFQRHNRNMLVCSKGTGHSCKKIWMCNLEYCQTCIQCHCYTDFDISSCINFLSFLSVCIFLYVHCSFPQQNVGNKAIISLEKDLWVKSCRKKLCLRLRDFITSVETRILIRYIHPSARKLAKIRMF